MEVNKSNMTDLVDMRFLTLFNPTLPVLCNGNTHITKQENNPN
jgi:hypothetical protein